MSMTNDPRLVSEELPPVVPQHYQLLCGLALGVIFLLLLQQGLLLFGLALLILGGATIVLRVPLTPLSAVLLVVGSQLYLHYVFPAWRFGRVLQLEDVALCAATLTLVAGHYRLLSLWSRILPNDPRQRYHKAAPVIVPLRRLGKVVAQHRPAAHLSRGEIAWFVVQLPLFALAAQGVWAVLIEPRNVLGLSLRWSQLLQLTWGLALILFVAAQFFRYARLLQMDGVTARLLLQDVLWHETRGEQRRIGRWLAWARLRGKSETRSTKSETNPESE
jgi:hypothetical protein